MSLPVQDWSPTVINKHVKNSVVKETITNTYINHSKNAVTVKKIYDPTNPDAEPELRPVMIDKLFGQQIQQARCEKKLSQKELANAICIPVQIITEYEKGTGIRNGNYVNKIKTYLNITSKK